MRFALLLLAVLTAGCSKVKEQQQAQQQVVADRADTAEAKARLGKIGSAMHSLNDTGIGIPSGVWTTNNRIGLSWRVLVLGSLGQEQYDLFKQFKLAEPWDSEHNKALIAKMPDIYATPGVTTEPGRTHLRSFVAVGSKHKAVQFNPTELRQGDIRPAGQLVRGRTLHGLQDGSAYTLLVVETAESVIWTKPEELEYDPGKPLPKLGVLSGGFLGLMGDQSVYLFPENLSPEALRRLILCDDMQVLPQDVLDLMKRQTPN